MISAFVDDAEVWLMIVGLIVMAWGFWPQWRRSYRRWRRRLDWRREPI